MKKPVSVTTAVVLSSGRPLPSHAGPRASESNPEGHRTVILLIDPVLLNLDEDGTTGVLNPGEVKYVA